jgi:hypothetical protein
VLFPIATLLLPWVMLSNEEYPTPVFFVPDVNDPNTYPPIAVLKLPVDDNGIVLLPKEVLLVLSLINE